jgi:hypothetical protein
MIRTFVLSMLLAMAGCAAYHPLPLDNKAEAKAVDLDVAWQEWQVAEEARMQAFRLIALRRAAPLATRRADGLKRWLGALEEAERRQEVSGAFVAQARSLYDLSRQDGRYRLAVREQFPPIGLAANYARDTSNVITFGLLAALDIPLFDRNQGNIAWEKASRRQLYDEYGARLFAARAQVASLRAGLDSSRKRLESAEAALPQLQETAKSYDQALDRGAASLSVWQEAQGAAIEEELRAISLEAELAQAGLSLEVASGEYLPGDGKAAPLNNKEKP